MKMVLKKYGSVWSNIDSGSKRAVQCSKYYELVFTNW